MKPSAIPAALLLASTSLALLASLVACRNRNDAATRTDASAAAPPAASPSAPSKGADGSACKSDADCAADTKCFFEEAGCGAAGKCRGSGMPSHTCYVAVAMCSCSRHETFYGGGGCAGQAVREAWELYACPCVADADCRGGQRCVPTVAGRPARPAATRECRPPQ